MTTENEQITPADAAIVSSGTGTKGPEERDLPASLKEEMDLCLQILREVLGEFDENLLAKFDEVREHALKASDERFSGILSDTNPDQDDLQKVVDIVDKMDVHDAQLLARAFTTYFHLANLCEENYRVSVLHSREAAVNEDQAVDPVNEMTCAYHQLINEMADQAHKVYEAKEQALGSPIMRELERICLLKCVDRMWMDHIDNMDQLRQGIALRGYGQKDPVVEYRIEGFDMFDQMVDSIRESSVKMLLTIEIRQAGAAPKREQVAKPTGEGFVPGNGAPGAKGAPKGQPVRVIKIGRNDPCPCGSGLKWKKCTCAQYHPDGANGGEQ